VQKAEWDEPAAFDAWDEAPTAPPEMEQVEPAAAFDTWDEAIPDDSETDTRPFDVWPATPDSAVHAAWDIAAHEEAGSTTQPMEANMVGMLETPDEAPDSDVAQLALSLTQASLELSAEATLLTHEGEIIAYAGHLSPEDIEELRAAIENDWAAHPDGARMRFVTLPSSGKDYMLYSILTRSDLTLSMIFGGLTPLRVIRKQGQILADALRAVPDVAPTPLPPPAPAPPAQAIVEAPVRVPFSFVWLLRDPDTALTDAAAQAIISGLTLQLSEQNWHIITLQVHEDFVYLLAEVPGETPPNLVMNELKRRSAEIARAQMPDVDTKRLWADSYLILTPGRELATEEILEFINFQRML
jgi:REP element-mobilizing transposase RayT